MPRRMSFAMTTDQLLDGSKTVTRRMGWRDLEAGARLLAVEKCMGLAKGEKHVILAEIEVVDVRREPLEAITVEDCIAEGFPDMSPAAFVGMFMSAMRCEAGDEVTRIEFRRIDVIGSSS